MANKGEGRNAAITEAGRHTAIASINDSCYPKSKSSKLQNAIKNKGGKGKYESNTKTADKPEITWNKPGTQTTHRDQGTGTGDAEEDESMMTTDKHVFQWYVP